MPRQKLSSRLPDRVAGCADCHTAHAIYKPEDSRSSINPDNLVNTCEKCHAHATTQFTRYYPHAEHSDRTRYPIIYWTFMGMTLLLAGTFAFFWIHTLLWMSRGFVENREHQIALMKHGAGHAIPDGYKPYRRFKRRHIFPHLLVITSFLGLALTGLPLKFAQASWAKTLMSLYGGTAVAGAIHRVAAGVTFIYFVTAIIMSIHFLFFRKDVEGGWPERLFGPDSLMPNPRDIRDVIGMFKWFFFRVLKPLFDRWTYWEKFDFLTVFWGMFAVGGFGLMLAFPEFFGMLLPGWMFNVATTIHFDEALLATGFIFTVHFFNTNFRPEKFPMDFVIFNGRITKQGLIEERGDQWKHYEKEGITERFYEPRASSVPYDFAFKAFGFLALLTGIVLTILMIVAFLA